MANTAIFTRTKHSFTTTRICRIFITSTPTTSRINQPKNNEGTQDERVHISVLFEDFGC